MVRFRGQRSQLPVVTAFVKDWFRSDTLWQEGPFGSTHANLPGQMLCVGREPSISDTSFGESFTQERRFSRYRLTGLASRRNAPQFVQPITQITAEITDRA